MKKDTRRQFFNSILKKARNDSKIVLLVGDLGYSFYEEFAEELPGQFINCGIAEQNMIGVATGLAIAGYKPYCYSGKVFINYRCLEQIRDAWLQGLDVKVVGAGTSGFLGFTHNFQKGEVEPLVALAKLIHKQKNYIRL
jgi:transketolase